MRELPKIQILHQETQKINNIPADYTKWPDSWKKVEFKEYPRFPQFVLPPVLPLSLSFEEILKKRRTKREFDTTYKISTKELSSLLFWSAGIREGHTSPENSFRFYPSGGARYPLELYFYFAGNDELPRATYHYNVKNHSIEQLIHVRNIETHFPHFSAYPWTHNPTLFLFITGLFERNTRKYKERGYRFVLLEAGVLLHNIGLVAEALGLGCCPIGSVFDNDFETRLDLAEDEKYLISTVIGKSYG